MSNSKDFKVKNGIKPTAYHEAVGTVVSGSDAYSLTGASYDSVSFSVAGQSTNPRDLQFRTDGTKLFVLDLTTDSVYQYSLSTAWDVSTASYDSKSFSVISQDTTPLGIAFNATGTKMYMCGGTATQSIYQYSLSTAWDISTASYDSVSLAVSGQDTLPVGIAFNADGTSMFVAGNATDAIYQYTLSTGFDLSTASYASKSFSTLSQEDQPNSVSFNSDGTEMFVITAVTDSVWKYTLSTAYDVSTAAYSGESFSLLSQDNGPYGGVFKSDGEKFYTVGSQNDTIYQYSTVQTTNTLDLSTGSVFEITPTSDITVSLSNPAASGTVSGATLLLDGAATNTYDMTNASYDSVSFSVATQDINPQDVFFKPDGTKMYVVGLSGVDVNEYNLSTAWDVSTASYLQAFSVSAQELNPTGIFFKPDGTKMYHLGLSGRDVNEYNLSTAWDISTASFLQLFSVSAQEVNPRGLFFKSDGTKMYVTGNSGQDVNEYSLSTAWSVSTASYVQNFSVATQEAEPYGVFFKPDGLSMYIIGIDGDEVNEYSLSTAWNISTASYVQNFSVAAQDTIPKGFFFKADGTKMYVIGDTTDTIYQYSTATSATITYDPTIQWAGGTAPTSPAIGETDILTFSTRDGGTTYSAALAIDGAQ